MNSIATCFNIGIEYETSVSHFHQPLELPLEVKVSVIALINVSILFFMVLYPISPIFSCVSLWHYAIFNCFIKIQSILSTNVLQATHQMLITFYEFIHSCNQTFWRTTESPARDFGSLQKVGRF